ncbi:hypothetical protein D5R55_34270 [Burkholderia cenocepacia]|uniref:Uncharacterized protein n=1 Tax=Burkholderia cenocepacia TaxID=95486 RepID=A0A3S9NJM9_9BURK|nr:hypothetical protein D5R55_34270 [Burkholderia cenocepacia]
MAFFFVEPRQEPHVDLLDGVAHVCVSRVSLEGREAPAAIAGSIRFDATKRAIDQVFTRLKV